MIARSLPAKCNLPFHLPPLSAPESSIGFARPFPPCICGRLVAPSGEVRHVIMMRARRRKGSQGAFQRVQSFAAQAARQIQSERDDLARRRDPLWRYRHDERSSASVSRNRVERLLRRGAAARSLEISARRLSEPRRKPCRGGSSAFDQSLRPNRSRKACIRVRSRRRSMCFVESRVGFVVGRGSADSGQDCRAPRVVGIGICLSRRCSARRK